MTIQNTKELQKSLSLQLHGVSLEEFIRRDGIAHSQNKSLITIISNYQNIL